jgi:uncharacterized protein YegP (UPF0339 family)
MIKFVIVADSDGQYHVRVTSGNNEPWFTSEGYPDKATAEESAENFWHSVRNASEFVLVKSDD